MARSALDRARRPVESAVGARHPPADCGANQMSELDRPSGLRSGDGFRTALGHLEAKPGRSAWTVVVKGFRCRRSTILARGGFAGV